MKTPALLFFLIFILIKSNGQVIDSLHQEKAEQIIERVASEKPLPPVFNQNITWQYETPQPHLHALFYYVERIVNGQMMDSVHMHAEVDDSLRTIKFTENFDYISSHTLTNYSYNIEKGEITFAYLLIPQIQPDRPGCFFYDTNLKRFHSELKNDTTPTIDKDYTLELKDKADREKNIGLDKKAFAFFEPKLLKAIDELYDLLFK